VNEDHGLGQGSHFRGGRYEGLSAIAKATARLAAVRSSGEAQKHAFLRNEASCNVEEIAFIWFRENKLHRLQKNDNWLRFLKIHRMH
jgi:hypothetical protein